MKQWDLESNSCIRTFHVNDSDYCLAATVDADRQLSGSSAGTVSLWDFATGKELASFEAHANIVTCLAVTPDGSSFVSGSWDESLKLWRFEALEQPVIQFSGHTDYVTACALSSDGGRLYSGSLDSSIREWDITTGQQLAIMQSHTEGVNSLALSGSLLVSGSYDKTVRLWRTGSVQLLHTLHHSDYVQSVAVSSDSSQRILSCGGSPNPGAEDYSVRVWDAASGALLAVLEGHSNIVWCVTVSSDGCLAASASDDKTVCVWDLASLRRCARLEGHDSDVESVLFV